MDRIAVTTGVVAHVTALLAASYAADSTALLTVALATGGVVAGGLTRSRAAFVEGVVAGAVGTVLAGGAATLFLTGPTGIPSAPALAGLGALPGETLVVVVVLAVPVGIVDGVVAKLVAGARSRAVAAMGV